MRTTQITKRIEAIEKQFATIQTEKKDTSYRRSGRYFGTQKADLTGCIVTYTKARTQHLNTYVVIPATKENQALYNELQDLKAILKQRRERKEAIDQKKKELRYNSFKKQGIYELTDIWNGHAKAVVLTKEESYSKSFDAVRLANTLKISVSDAELLKSSGKTYVFAKSEDGNTYQLYHADTSVNRLNITISIATPEIIAQFKPEEWHNAPFAHHVGNSFQNNHFVC